MTALEALRMAVQGLISNRLRTLLTMLGITIGVASVIVLVAVGHGSAVKVNSQIESLGTNTLTVMPGGGFGFGRRGGPASTSQQLTLKDAAALEDKQQAPDILTVAPVVNADATLSYNGTSYTPSQFVGTTPSYASARDEHIDTGTFFSDQDEKDQQRYLVVGPTVVTNLFGGQNPVGQTVKVNGVSFHGQRRARQQGHERHPGSGRHRDRAALDHAQLAHGHHRRPRSDRDPGALEQGGRRRGGRDRRAPRAHAHERRQHDLPRAQPGLAARDDQCHQPRVHRPARDGGRDFPARGRNRRHEYHARHGHRAHARDRHPQGDRRQARATSSASSSRRRRSSRCSAASLGVLIGLVGSRFKIVGVQPAVQLYAVALAFSVGVAVGVFFGFYPANRAAALRPIDALRFE